jgi:hypothetical protein
MAQFKSKHAVLLTLRSSQYARNAMQCNAMQYNVQCNAMQCMHWSPSVRTKSVSQSVIFISFFLFFFFSHFLKYKKNDKILLKPVSNSGPLAKMEIWMYGRTDVRNEVFTSSLKWKYQCKCQYVRMSRIRQVSVISAFSSVAVGSKPTVRT